MVNRYWLGKHRSQETKDKLRISALNQFKNGMSEETKKKISITSTGTGNHFYGKNHNESARKKMRDSHYIQLDLDFIKSEYLSGKSTIELSKLLSVSDSTISLRLKDMGIELRKTGYLKGHKTSEETRRRISKANTGRKGSQEFKERMSKIQTGRTYEQRMGLEKAREVRRLRSEQQKNKFIQNPSLREKYSKDMTGSGNHFYGKKHSKDTLENLSKAHKERYKKNPQLIQNFKELRKKMILPVRDTKIEIKIQDFLRELNIEFYTHQYIKEIEHGYQCDILIPSTKTIIECDGDYWHNYPSGREIDRLRTSELVEKGFKVIRLWEHEIKQIDSIKLNQILTNGK